MDGEDKFVPARILWMRRWSPRLLSFRLERAPGFRFVPGQFARLGLKTPDGVPVWRAYSMASCRSPKRAIPRIFPPAIVMSSTIPMLIWPPV